MATAASTMAARPVKTNVRTGCLARARRNRRRSPSRGKRVLRWGAPALCGPSAGGPVTASPSLSRGTDTGSSSRTESGERAWERCGPRGVVTGFQYTGGLRRNCAAGPSRRYLHLPVEPESVLAPEQLANGLVLGYDGIGVRRHGVQPTLRLHRRRCRSAEFGCRRRRGCRNRRVERLGHARNGGLHRLGRGTRRAGAPDVRLHRLGVTLDQGGQAAEEFALSGDEFAAERGAGRLIRHGRSGGRRRARPPRRGDLLPESLVLRVHPRQLLGHAVQELVHLALVVAAKAGLAAEHLLLYIRRRQAPRGGLGGLAHVTSVLPLSHVGLPLPRWSGPTVFLTRSGARSQFRRSRVHPRAL